MQELILVVDDDPYVVSTVMDLLATKYEVYGAVTGDELVAMLDAHKFDLVVLDLGLGKSGHGLDWVRRIQETGAKVLVLTTRVDDEDIFGAFRAAVNGILHKQEGTAYLLPAVEGALAGYNMTSPTLVARYVDGPNRLPRLSWQERVLIDYLFANPHDTNDQIGNALHLAGGTVKNKFERLFQKLNVHKRHQLLDELRRRGYRPLEKDEGDAGTGETGILKTVVEV